MSAAKFLGPRPRSPLSISLVLLGVTGTVLATVELILVVDAAMAPAWIVALFPLSAMLYVVVGLTAWARRPANRMGALLLLGGLAMLLGGLANVRQPLLNAIGIVAAVLIIGVVVHLLHAFPAGRVRGSVGRWTVAGAYVCTIVVYAPQYLFSSGGQTGDLLKISDSPGAYHAARVVGAIVVTVILTITAVVLTRRVLDRPRGERTAPTVVYAYGIGTAFALPFAANVLPTFGFDALSIAVTQLALLAGVPPVFTIAMLRGGFSRADGVDALTMALESSARSPSAIQPALAAAIGDPSVRLLESDEAVASPRQKGRGRVELRIEGRAQAAIDYDAVLIGSPETVRSAAQLIAIVLERDRLAADLKRGEAELERSRDRIAAAADAERRRIARDLHDGLQSKLVMLALRVNPQTDASVAVATSRHSLSADVEAAIDELRRVIAGVMPPTLIERDLGAALEDLTDRMPVPVDLRIKLDGRALEPAVESTVYFVVAEALTNAIKHAEASRVGVDVETCDDRLRFEIVDDGCGGAALGGGFGLVGMQDRIQAVGGRVTIASPPGDGTRVIAEVPCAS